jgi:hypothetical protein
VHPTDHWAAGSSSTQCSLQPAAAASSCRHLLSHQGYKRRIPEPRTQFRLPSLIVWYYKICLKTRSDQQGASHRHLPSAMAKLALLLLAIALLAAPAFAQGPQSRKILDAVANADASAYSSGGAHPNTQLRASGRSGVARPTSPLPGSLRRHCDGGRQCQRQQHWRRWLPLANVAVRLPHLPVRPLLPAGPAGPAGRHLGLPRLLGRCPGDRRGLEQRVSPNDSSMGLCVHDPVPAPSAPTPLARASLPSWPLLPAGVTVSRTPRRWPPRRRCAARGATRTPLPRPTPRPAPPASARPSAPLAASDPESGSRPLAHAPASLAILNGSGLVDTAHTCLRVCVVAD